MVTYRISSTMRSEIALIRAIPLFWLSEGVHPITAPDIAVLEKARLDYGDAHAEMMLPHIRQVDLRSGLDLRAAHAYLTAATWAPCDTKLYETTVNAAQGAIDAFFERHFRTLPGQIDVHLTRVGRGGSYHPAAQNPMSAGEGISVRPDRRPDHPLFILLHETVHLVINAEMDRRFGFGTIAAHRAKEAIVETICRSQEAQELLGGNPQRLQYAPTYLPADWVNFGFVKTPFSV